jgi:hypothetical protein
LCELPRSPHSESDRAGSCTRPDAGIGQCRLLAGRKIPLRTEGRLIYPLRPAWRFALIWGADLFVIGCLRIEGEFDFPFVERIRQ